ncbi:DUF1254 domain-containing protein [Actinomadura luteofluorescens]|uniref:DUF1254 domain-containing protein n=1 Tax=Actinomadura luteofluorescens TaxID=46163 RepID=UPI001C5445BE|nr:DUF1254 domain-containing protein [Actinomadura luteofluorescens]
MPHVSDAPSPGISAETLASISVPDRLETVFGEMDFFDGLPLPDTVTRGYDALDLLRGIEVFLTCLPGAAMVAMRRGLRSLGIDSRTIGYTAPRCGSAPLMLTANTETAYGLAFLALDQDGPTVIEVPEGSLSVVDDLWQRYVADMGIAGPDGGKGGRYLFLPPGYDGDVPDGYFVSRSPTFSCWAALRVLGGVESLLRTRIYPLSDAADPPGQRFVNFADSAFNTVPANDLSFFEEVDEIVQEEPPEALDPERAGQLASIGIVPGTPFRPDDRMRSILGTAAQIGSGLVRTLTFKPRDPSFYYYPGGSWKNMFPSGSHEFLSPQGARLLDARAVFHHGALVITPAMAAATVGAGSQYAYTAEDSTGAWLDGGRNYTLTLPKDVPAKNFWAVDVYDPQTRSLLRTGDPYPSVNSLSGAVRAEDGGETVVHFGPAAPPGREANWIQTVPGKGWFVVLRLYGPLESWFDRSWRPGEVEPA